MKRILKSILVALAVVMLISGPAMADTAKITSGVNTVALSMTVNDMITVTCSPLNISFNYNAGSNSATASGPITCNQTWSLDSSYHQFQVYAWLPSVTNALTNGSINIPASDVMGSVDGGPAAPCVESPGGPDGFSLTGATCDSWQPVPYTANLTTFTGTSTDTLLLSLSGLPSLAAGTYTGTLMIEGGAE